jgi:hypothetical protein
VARSLEADSRPRAAAAVRQALVVAVVRQAVAVAVVRQAVAALRTAALQTAVGTRPVVVAPLVQEAGRSVVAEPVPAAGSVQVVGPLRGEAVALVVSRIPAVARVRSSWDSRY